MTRLSLVLAAALCLVSPLAQAAGFRQLEVPAVGPSPPLQGAVWFPCDRPTEDISLGPFRTSVSKNCPIEGRNLPLIVISHGRAGSFLGHFDTAEALANAGFIVAAISHPGDNAMDKGRASKFSVLVERPADMKRLIDYMLGSWPDAGQIDGMHVGLFGFSRGGYTGLVAIGANPAFGRRLRLCEGDDSALCDQVRNGRPPDLAHDARIKAAVIADPLSVFFTQDSFRGVTVPVQLWASERGGDGVAPESVAAVAGELMPKPEFHPVPKSQHFDFLPPCPDELAKMAPELCLDAPGFDRAAFHRQFNADVVAFFRQHLVDGRQP